MERNLQLNLRSTSLKFVLLVLLGMVSMQGSAQTVIENGKLRFGNGSQNSVNATGNLQQPFYYSVQHSSWRRLTFSNISLNETIAFGGDGTDDWNTQGTRISDCALTNQIVNTSGFEYITGTSGAGSGQIISTGTLSADGRVLEVENTYTIASSCFITIKTKITNIGSVSAPNLRYWIGTRDDYVGGIDEPLKERGNLEGGNFALIANATDQAKAIRIKTAQEGVLFFSTSDRTQTIINNCCSWDNVLYQNPSSAPISVTNDGSYGIYVRMNDLAPEESDEFIWYYAAANLTDLDALISQVAVAAGGLGNVTCNSAVYEAQSNVQGTGYLMTVPDGAVAPDAEQIKAGVAYGGVTPISALSQAMTTDSTYVFSISGLLPNTTYKTYFVLEDTNAVFMNVTNADITTAGNPEITFTVTDANCINSSDGVLTASATNGTAPFVFHWTDGPADATYSNLNAGDYEVLATDANNCQATATTTITVLDTIKPDFFLESIELELNDEGVSFLSQNMVLPYASDNCAIAEVEIQTQSYSCESLQEGTSTQILVTDIYGNSAQKTLLVNVVDRSYPEIEVMDIEIELNHDGMAVLTSEMLDMRERDNCGIVSHTLSKTQFSCEDLGSSIIVMTVSDFSGNASSTSFSVSVVDKMAPQIIQPEPIQMCEGILESVSIIVSDNCSAQLEQIDGPVPGYFLTQGEYALTYLATDASGNEASVSVELLVFANPLVNLGDDIEATEGTMVTLTAGDDAGATYLWSTGETDNEIMVEVTESTTISVQVYSETGCMDEDKIFIELLNPLGVDDIEKGGIQVYPNPTADYLNIVPTGADNLEGVAIRIFNMNGKMVYAQGSGSFIKGQPSVLDLSNLSKGVYVLSLQSDYINATQRIVKQ
ncbi:T9SS type A sorting domain-containing protein [Cryomorpha ignava]|uniref:T9SS type A sorting domain-containing protein n=1 Tax=Cryomorpha ignava TaxID=101383 RepID=A0A7K3WRJ2_9FLAO|nr:T9SS type A sorting domain-containing protein [Cryomorpha ignava]NEN24293.1 T9SS type A sorting domain-containing protein [Cryomorpha ignava]